jgi:hypothetical protein
MPRSSIMGVNGATNTRTRTQASISEGSLQAIADWLKQKMILNSL